MKKRLSKIITRKGDDGTTSLDGKNRLPKNDIRIEAVGSLDELNCAIGLAIAHLAGNKEKKEIKDALLQIQNHLFDAGGELCPPCQKAITENHVLQLEKIAEGWNADLPPLLEFVLPGGTLASANCHLARAICRRCERILVSFNQQEKLNPELLRYINRLSDVLFIASRVLQRAEGVTETCWQGH